jgi:PTS system nitrogen regulatory IIA component
MMRVATDRREGGSVRYLDRFSAADVILDVAASNKAGLLEFLATEVAQRHGLAVQSVLDALKAREQIGSTALGQGIALPHAELRGAESPAILFARLSRPLDFDAEDDQLVELVFVVLWPAANRKGLLNAVSEICGALRDPQALRRLRTVADPQEVARIVREAAPSAAEEG